MNASIDKYLNLQDRIRLLLNDHSERDVPMTVDDIARNLRKRGSQVYQALYRMASNGEIELLKEARSNGRDKVVGIRKNKLAPTGRTYHKAAERAKDHIEISQAHGVPEMPTLQNYLTKRQTIDKMREEAEKAGLNPDEVVRFEPDPIAEEGLMLLGLLTQASQAIEQLTKDKQMLTYDLDAEKRNVEHLKSRAQENMQQELAGATS